MKYTNGIFITTSYFQQEALRIPETHKNLVIIDQEQLVELVYKYKVGVLKRGNQIEIKTSILIIVKIFLLLNNFYL